MPSRFGNKVNTSKRSDSAKWNVLTPFSDRTIFVTDKMKGMSTHKTYALLPPSSHLYPLPENKKGKKSFVCTQTNGIVSLIYHLGVYIYILSIIVYFFVHGCLSIKVSHFQLIQLNSVWIVTISCHVLLEYDVYLSCREAIAKSAIHTCR